MKTILVWDPRFPDSAPARLSVEDTVASAAVRSGIAAAADPAQQGALMVGGPIDGSMLTEVVIQNGTRGTARVFLPFSVVMIGAAAGVLASIGMPVPGKLGPAPTPASILALSPANPSILTSAAVGSLVAIVTNVPAGVTPSVTPNDGRLVIAGNA